MTTRRGCPWCHELNVVTGGPVFCAACGHRADVCRADCDCHRCRPARDEADLLNRLPPTDCGPGDIPFG